MAERVCRDCGKKITGRQSYASSASIRIGSPHIHFDCLMRRKAEPQPELFFKEGWKEQPVPTDGKSDA